MEEETTRHGVFNINTKEFFKNNKTSKNFCHRNKVISEFPALIGCHCALNIQYQYRQFGKKDKTFIKITGNCNSGPCRHEYKILQEPTDEIAEVRYKVIGLFLDQESMQLMHHSYSSTPIKGAKRDNIFEYAQRHGCSRAYSNCLDSVSTEAVEAKNLTTLVSPFVIRNILSERTKDQFVLSIVKKQVEERQISEYDPECAYSGLLRNVMSEPYSIYMYTQEQLEIAVDVLKNNDWNSPIILSFDTSGDILPLSRTSTGNKKLYHFAQCLTTTTGTIVGVLFKITNLFFPCCVDTGTI